MHSYSAKMADIQATHTSIQRGHLTWIEKGLDKIIEVCGKCEVLLKFYQFTLHRHCVLQALNNQSLFLRWILWQPYGIILLSCQQIRSLRLSCSHNPHKVQVFIWLKFDFSRQLHYNCLYMFQNSNVIFKPGMKPTSNVMNQHHKTFDFVQDNTWNM